MKKLIKPLVFLLSILIIVLIGNHMLAPEKEGVSRNIAELQATVRLAVPAKAIKWEIFGTPEDTGGFGVGPTDYITLVAELEPSDAQWFASQEGELGHVWIAPESARAWLSDYFRALLIKSDGNMSELKNCKPFQTEMTTSGRIVKGFSCEHDGKLLIHVLLLAPSF